MKWQLMAAAAVLAGSAAPAFAAPPVPQTVQIRGLFGESDEEKAARLKAEARENDQDAGIAELRQRMSDLEQALRIANGTNEQLSHQLNVMSQRLDKQQKDYDYKLCELSSQVLGTAGQAPGQGALPCDFSGGSQAAPQASAQPSQAMGSGPNGGTLGTLPANPGVQAGAPAGDPARGQYDEAMNLLARARYDEARAAFRGFADANPKDSLAPQAVYWVGNIAFVQKDYAAAASAFAEQIKKYPSSPQGAESMLKLGQSLIGLGEKKEGCLTLGAIKSKYKQAPANILTQAANARDKFCAK
ncbi:tol-pal system protein YbgF [Rhizomicrobium palustre]